MTRSQNYGWMDTVKHMGVTVQQANETMNALRAVFQYFHCMVIVFTCICA